MLPYLFEPKLQSYYIPVESRSFYKNPKINQLFLKADVNTAIDNKR